MVVVYCDAGYKGSLAASILARNGYPAPGKYPRRNDRISERRISRRGGIKKPLYLKMALYFHFNVCKIVGFMNFIPPLQGNFLWEKNSLIGAFDEYELHKFM